MRTSLILVASVVALAASSVGANTPVAAGADAELAAMAKSPAGHWKIADKPLSQSPADVAIAIKSFLARKRLHTDDERRVVLATIKADVPDASGRFKTPGRKKTKQKKREDAVDWLTKVSQLPASTTALGEVAADIAAIRMLVRTRNVDAAATLLDFAFTEVGMVYRDECGRYLRKMEPESLPALIRASKNRKQSPSKARYANYQLERLDRQDAHKALDAAGNALKPHILKAYADAGYREAVYAVLDHVDHIDPTVRTAARDAWAEYIAGKPPREAPKRKLVLPGGKESEEEEPLWLNHRELADIELRRRLESNTGSKPNRSATLTAMSTELFAHYDKRRITEASEHLQAGSAAAEQGDLGAAATHFDSVLAADPAHPKRSVMANVYLQYGQQLAEAKQWNASLIALAKARATGAETDIANKANDAYSRVRADASRDNPPESEVAKLSAELDEASTSEPSATPWLLYVGIGWLTAGLILLAWGMTLRNRRNR